MMDIWPKIAKFLEEKGPEIARNMAILFEKVVPFMFAGLAFYQIVARREWEGLVDNPDEEGEKDPSLVVRVPDEPDELKKVAQ